MSKQNIYVAMGSLAYAVAKADGQVHPEEKATIKKIAQEVLFSEDISNDYIDKMFETMERENISVTDAYNYALDILEANKYEYDFYDSTKRKCLQFMEIIADAFQGTSTKELDVITRFKRDIEKY